MKSESMDFVTYMWKTGSAGRIFIFRTDEGECEVLVKP